MPAASAPRDGKAAVVLSLAAGFVGGLCCLTPVVLVLVGLAGVSAANSLGNTLYGDYKWLFRAAALAFLVLALLVYLRRTGVCTLEQARRQRNRIVNLTALVLIASTAVYVFWTYVVLHYWGILAGLPWAQWDESWAIPLSILLFAAAALVSVWIFASRRKRALAPSTPHHNAL
ncbi:MAG: mercuric transporter MerT family protein [Bryobacteraceae bacterium]